MTKQANARGAAVNPPERTAVADAFRKLAAVTGSIPAHVRAEQLELTAKLIHVAMGLGYIGFAEMRQSFAAAVDTRDGYVNFMEKVAFIIEHGGEVGKDREPKQAL